VTADPRRTQTSVGSGELARSGGWGFISRARWGFSSMIRTMRLICWLNAARSRAVYACGHCGATGQACSTPAYGGLRVSESLPCATNQSNYRWWPTFARTAQPARGHSMHGRHALRIDACEYARLLRFVGVGAMITRAKRRHSYAALGVGVHAQVRMPARSGTLLIKRGQQCGWWARVGSGVSGNDSQLARCSSGP